MCFDHDSRPPIQPIAGAAIDSRELTLTAADGNQLTAFEARPPEAHAAIVILPDVRGLHDYYAELAMRFAEAGVDAVAIDWFGRTAGLGRRHEGFDHAPQVQQLRWDGMAADIRAGAEHAKATFRGGRLFTVGFCMGGRAAFLSPTLGLGLNGAIGFYGSPVGAGRGGSPEPVDLTDQMEGRVLGLFGGADESIPPAAIGAFDEALKRAGIDHDLRTYDGAPHSFFDRKADQYADASADAWRRILEFVA
jgi:carboxymethylenebutenolidase